MLKLKMDFNFYKLVIVFKRLTNVRRVKHNNRFINIITTTIIIRVIFCFLFTIITT